MMEKRWGLAWRWRELRVESGREVVADEVRRTAPAGHSG
jgi:hypothetical protein